MTGGGPTLHYNSEDVIVNCPLFHSIFFWVGGWLVPQDVVEMRDIVTCAKFVLVVEKDSNCWRKE